MPGFVGSTYDATILLSTKTGPVDLTTYVLEVDAIGALTTVVLTVGNAGVIVNAPTSGVIAIHLTSAQTTALGAGKVSFNYWNTSPDRQILAIGSDVIQTIAQGDGGPVAHLT